MPTDSISSLLDIAKSAAQAAGKVVMEIYDSGDYKSYQKDDDSPVTSADYKANEVILAILKRKTPHIPIMSEESDNGALDERKDWHRYWLIDPIDGTQEFIARLMTQRVVDKFEPVHVNIDDGEITGTFRQTGDPVF